MCEWVVFFAVCLFVFLLGRGGGVGAYRTLLLYQHAWQSTHASSERDKMKRFCVCEGVFCLGWCVWVFLCLNVFLYKYI